MALGVCTQGKVIYHPAAPRRGFLSSALLNPCPVASRDSTPPPAPHNPPFTKSAVTAEGTAGLGIRTDPPIVAQIADLLQRLLYLPGCRTDGAGARVSARFFKPTEGVSPLLCALLWLCPPAALEPPSSQQQRGGRNGLPLSCWSHGQRARCVSAELGR